MPGKEGQDRTGQDILFAKISLETPANLFDNEFRSSSTTRESSAVAEVSVVPYA